MKLPFRQSFARSCGAVLVCLLLAGAPAAAAAAPPAPAAAAPVLANSYVDSAWHVVETSVNSRAGLLRVGVVGMVIALFIIMANHKWSK